MLLLSRNETNFRRNLEPGVWSLDMSDAAFPAFFSFSLTPLEDTVAFFVVESRERTI